jgi:hypothetical protein
MSYFQYQSQFVDTDDIAQWDQRKNVKITEKSNYLLWYLKREGYQFCMRGFRGRDRMVGSWMYDYLCNQCLSPLTLWVQILLWRYVLDTTFCDKVCQWLATAQWFSPSTLVSSTNKTNRHDITEILLKVVLNTITLTLILHGHKQKDKYSV